MRSVLVSTFSLLVLCVSIAQAADPQLTKHVAALQQQVNFLKQELTRLKSVVDLAPDGTTRITAPQHKQEVTGTNSQVEVGGSASERIGTAKSISVGTNQTETVGQDWNQHIGRNAVQRVGTDLSMTSGKRTIISAGDQLILKTGQASIVLNKNGDILILGKTIQIKGSGEVNIKGSKVTTN